MIEASKSAVKKKPPMRGGRIVKPDYDDVEQMVKEGEEIRAYANIVDSLDQLKLLLD